MKKKNGSFEIYSSLKFFGVDNEEDIVKKVENDWHKSNCVRCGAELDLMTCSYSDGDPICRGGFCKNNF